MSFAAAYYVFLIGVFLPVLCMRSYFRLKAGARFPQQESSSNTDDHHSRNFVFLRMDCVEIFRPARFSAVRNSMETLGSWICHSVRFRQHDVWNMEIQRRGKTRARVSQRAAIARRNSRLDRRKSFRRICGRGRVSRSLIWNFDVLDSELVGGGVAVRRRVCTRSRDSRLEECAVLFSRCP